MLNYMRKKLEREWSLKYSRCEKCHKTTRPHKAKGLCDTCYNNYQYNNNEEWKTRRIASMHKYYSNNREKMIEAMKEYYYSHKKNG